MKELYAGQSVERLERPVMRRPAVQPPAVHRPGGRNMIRRCFRLPANLDDDVRMAAKLDGRSMSEWVRRAVSEKLAREQTL